MDDDLKIKVSAPGADEAKRKLHGIASAEGKVSSEGEKATRTFGRMRGALTSILGALGIGTGIAAAMAKLVELARQWAAHMDRVAQASERAGREMVAFAMMQEPGTVGEATRSAAKLGAEYLVTPGQAWMTVQRFQGKGLSLADSLKGAKAAWELARTGVRETDAVGGTLAGIEQGLTAQESATLLYVAGEASSLSPAELAPSASVGLQPFRGLAGPRVGMGGMAGLSASFGQPGAPGRLPTMTAAAGRAFLQTEGRPGALWKRLGFKKPGMDPLAQRRALRGAGITTLQDLMGAGFNEEQASALAALMGAAGLDEQVARIVTGSQDLGVMGRKWASVYEESPEVRHAYDKGRLKAELALSRLWGPSAPQARRREIQLKEAGLALTEAGYGTLVDEPGDPTWWAGVSAALQEGPSYGAWAPTHLLERTPYRQAMEKVHRAQTQQGRVVNDYSQHGYIINQDSKIDPAGQIPRVDR